MSNISISGGPYKVVVDLTPILPGGENGGAKIFVLELIKQLSNIAKNTEFILFTQAASHSELSTLDGKNVRRLLVVKPSFKIKFRKYLRRSALHLLPFIPSVFKFFYIKFGHYLNLILKRNSLHSLLEELDADLLFCPFTAPTYFTNGVPTVCTIYDLQYRAYPDFFSDEDAINRDFAFLDASKKADALIAISEFSKNEAIAYANFKILDIQTVYLRTATRFRDTKNFNDCLQSKFGLVSKNYLLYPANFWPHKNHEKLLCSFKLALGKSLNPNIKLVCTGAPSPRRDFIIQMTIDLGLSDHVFFPGFISNEELSVLLSNSSALFFPSLYEGFGLPLIEAMAGGVPVACSNTTSLPEVVGNAAIFFDPKDSIQMADAMVTIVNNEPLRAQLIKDGRKRAEEFSDSERMAREYLEIFRRVSGSFPA